MRPSSFGRFDEIPFDGRLYRSLSKFEEHEDIRELRFRHGCACHPNFDDLIVVFKSSNELKIPYYTIVNKGGLSFVEIPE